MMEAFRSLPQSSIVVSSNFVARSREEACTGCGKCAAACPIDAIELIPAAPTERVPKRKKRATVDDDRCLGCGVCHTACDFGGLAMEPAARRVYTPENTIEKNIRIALERGTLSNLLFSDPHRLTHRALAAFLGGLLALPPAKQALARDQIKSRFVGLLMDRLKPGSKVGSKPAEA
jgi:ferredoxin